MSITIDPALAMDANYRFGPSDRRYIDDQVRTLQQALSDLIDPPSSSVTTISSTGTLNNVDTSTAAGTAILVRFTGAAPTITGLTLGSEARRIYLAAVGGDLTLSNQSGSSTPANRLITGAGTVVIPVGSLAELVYDVLSLRWRLTSGAGAAGSLASPTITGIVTYQGTKFRVLSIPGEVQTTTATTAVIASFTMLDETSCDFAFSAGMKGVAGVTKSGGWDGKVTYQRNAAGAPAIVGAVEYGTSRETVVGDGVTFDISGNDVRVLATAADADDRNWTCEFRVAETLAT